VAARYDKPASRRRHRDKKHKKNKQEKKRKKNIELDSRKVASKRPWRCLMLSFFFDFVTNIVRGLAEIRLLRSLGGFAGPSASR